MALRDGAEKTGLFTASLEGVTAPRRGFGAAALLSIPGVGRRRRRKFIVRLGSVEEEEEEEEE